MHTEVESLLRTAKSEDEVRCDLQSLCEPRGPVGRTDVLSGADAPCELMCVVQMADRPAADRVADRFGANAFNNRLVVFKYEAPADFAYS